MGWRVVYEPESRVRHLTRATIKRYYEKNLLSYMSYRNFYFFLWKNFDEVNFLKRQMSDLNRALITNPRDREMLNPFLEAAKKLEAVFTARRYMKGRQYRLRDVEVIAKFAEYIS